MSIPSNSKVRKTKNSLKMFIKKGSDKAYDEERD